MRKERRREYDERREKEISKSIAELLSSALQKLSCRNICMFCAKIEGINSGGYVSCSTGLSAATAAASIHDSSWNKLTLNKL